MELQLQWLSLVLLLLSLLLQLQLLRYYLHHYLLSHHLQFQFPYLLLWELQLHHPMLFHSLQAPSLHREAAPQHFTPLPVSKLLRQAMWELLH